MSFRGQLIKAGIVSDGQHVSFKYGIGLHVHDAQLLQSARFATGTAGGSYLDIDATNFQWQEGWELRYNVVDWEDSSAVGYDGTTNGTGFLNAFTGFKIATQCATESAAGKTLQGIDSDVRVNNVTAGDVSSIKAHAYIKGSSSKTVNNVFGGESEVEVANSSGTLTVTTKMIAHEFRMRISTAVAGANLTKCHGVVVKCGCTDGTTKTVGTGLLIENYSSGGGTVTWTTGLKITDSITAINVSEACVGNGLTSSCVFQHGSYSNAVAHGAISAHTVISSVNVTAKPTSSYYLMGNVCRIANSEASTGGVMIGHYGFVALAYSNGDAYAMRGRVNISATAALGLTTGLLVDVNISGVSTITAATGGSINGIVVDMNCESGVAAIAQEIHGILIDTSGMAMDPVGLVSALKIQHSGGSNYLDYGIFLSNCFNSSAVAIFIQATQDNLGTGIKFDAGGHTMTTALSFNATGAITYFADFTGTTGANGTCYEDDQNAATDIEGKIMCLDKDGNKIYINCYRTEN